RAVRRGVAARAGPHRQPRRSGPAGRDGRLAVGGHAGAAREPLARAARGTAPTRRVRLRLRRDRADRGQEQGQRATAGEPGAGALLRDGDGRLVGVWALEIADGEIAALNSIVNPDKLAHLGPVANTKALLRYASRVRGV